MSIDSVREVKRSRFFSNYLMFFLIFLTITFGLYLKFGNRSNETIYESNLALIIAVSVFAFSVLISYRDHGDKIIEFEIDLINKSLEKFYLPLYELLIIRNRDMNSNSAKTSLFSIYSYKYLAEPEIRAFFDVYFTEGCVSLDMQDELLTRITKDMEKLSKKYSKLKKQLF